MTSQFPQAGGFVLDYSSPVIVLCQVGCHGGGKTQEHPLDPKTSQKFPRASALSLLPLSLSLYLFFLTPLRSTNMLFEVQAVIYNPCFSEYHIQM